MSFIDHWLFPATLAGALGSGLVAGIFFAFSNFVMKALARIPEEQGMRAMQAINVTVLNPLFLPIFLGTAAVSVLLGIISMIRWHAPGAALLLVGSVFYFVGNFVVTVVCNVPRNDALARLDPVKPESAPTWRNYVAEWTRWNHVRTITALAASAAFTLALCQ